MDHGCVYWIPGSQDIGASTPIPPNGTHTAKCNAHLMQLGPSDKAVDSANTSSTEYKGTMNAPANIFDPGPLKPAVKYYWHVDSIRQSVITKGPVWNFKCY